MLIVDRMTQNPGWCSAGANEMARPQMQHPCSVRCLFHVGSEDVWGHVFMHWCMVVRNGRALSTFGQGHIQDLQRTNCRQVMVVGLVAVIE